MIVAKEEANINIKDNNGSNALYNTNDYIDNKETAKIILESGRLKYEEMNGIEHFTKNEDGSMEFQYTDWNGKKFLIQMESSTSVKSIKKVSD